MARERERERLKVTVTSFRERPTILPEFAQILARPWPVGFSMFLINQVAKLGICLQRPQRNAATLLV
jgi:hypothetical protein